MKENTIVLNLKANEPTANGHVYSKKVLLKALADKKEIFIENHITSDNIVDIKNIIGSTQLEIKEDNSISGPFKKFDTTAWDNLKDIPFENLSFTIKGVGNFNNKNEVTDLKLISVCAFPKDRLIE